MCVCVFVSPIMVYIGSCLRPDTTAINRKLGTIFQASAPGLSQQAEGGSCPSTITVNGKRTKRILNIMWLRGKQSSDLKTKYLHMDC